MKAIVSEKGQVTIPKALRDSMGIKPGQVLEFEEQRGTLVARKCMDDEDPLDQVYGILKGQFDTDEFLDEIRGPRPT
ncbi:MAG: AbrB/MazE/SpoVT family DNA-binding domain-containing protein [Chloroflexi bacterium]|nr:AbrB/MazE/SpoVT family DNA-binding domain-containing protein [Chloroflexota bacterium]